MKKDQDLELNIKYSLGRRVFWFLFFKNNKKIILFLISLLFLIYFLNTNDFKLWLSNMNTILTTGILTLWAVSLFFGVFIIMLVSTFERYIQHKFLLAEHSFHIRKGFFMIKEKVIPYRHIQNVDIEQPYHYRILGLAKLNITTARMDNFEDEKTNLIPIIDKNLARKLSEFLISQGVKSHHSNSNNINLNKENIFNNINQNIY